MGGGRYLIRQRFAILFGKQKQSAWRMNFPLPLLFWFGNTLSVTSPSWQMHGDFNLKWSSQLSGFFFQSLHLKFWSDYFPSLCKRGKKNAGILHGFSRKLSLFVALSSWLFKVSLARRSDSIGAENKISFYQKNMGSKGIFKKYWFSVLKCIFLRHLNVIFMSWFTERYYRTLLKYLHLFTLGKTRSPMMPP